MIDDKELEKILWRGEFVDYKLRSTKALKNAKAWIRHDINDLIERFNEIQTLLYDRNDIENFNRECIYFIDSMKIVESNDERFKNFLEENRELNK